MMWPKCDPVFSLSPPLPSPTPIPFFLYSFFVFCLCLFFVFCFVLFCFVLVCCVVSVVLCCVVLSWVVLFCFACLFVCFHYFYLFFVFFLFFLSFLTPPPLPLFLLTSGICHLPVTLLLQFTMVTPPAHHWLKWPSYCAPRFINNNTPPSTFSALPRFTAILKNSPRNLAYPAI